MISPPTQQEEIETLATRMAYAFVILFCIAWGAVIDFIHGIDAGDVFILVIMGILVYFVIIFEFDHWIHFCQKYYFRHFEIDGKPLA